MEYDVFISYSRKDSAVAEEICRAFDKAGISYFIDWQGIGGGLEFPDVLARAIKASRIFLFLASRNSYESKFTQNEIVYAFNKKERGRILPYIIDDSCLPDGLDFTFASINWRRRSEHPVRTVLVNDILKILGREIVVLPPDDHKNDGPTLLSGIAGHEYVDLGLSVKWATCNVGAASPSDHGDYFAWGEVSSKSEYTDSNSVTFGEKIGNISGDIRYDVARARWGGSWRLPKQTELRELVDKCTWTWTTVNGKNGYKVTGKNGNSIFLPAAGWRYGPSLSYAGEDGDYWSATPHEYDPYGAYNLYLHSGDHDVRWRSRYGGRSVRPISE